MIDSKNITSKKQRLQQIVDILKFVLTLDDEELLKSSVESVIDLLEEEISKRN
jgi:Trp operon repressor